MTLELARKRRDQGEFIIELVETLADLATAVHSDRNHAGHFWDCYRMGCSSTRTLNAKAKEHDCIPWDDAREVAQQ